MHPNVLATLIERQDVKARMARPSEETLVTLSEERCPTCDGTGSIMRENREFPCPTCSPSNDVSVPRLATADPHNGGALRIVRAAAYVVGAVAVLAVLALLIKAAWQ
jgi:hypothetical protein